MNMHKTFLIGIDAGGTKTRIASRFSDQTVAEYFTDEGINIKRDGLSNAAALCIDLIKKACKESLTGNQLILCAGIAGAGRDHDKQFVQDQLTDGFPKAESVHCSVITDADIAYYAAHGNASGVLMIVGTGSIVLAKTKEGTFVRTGGWGRLLGDEAGGYKLGQAGLTAVAQAFDGGPSTKMSILLKEAFHINSADALIEFTYNKDTAIQSVAPLVLKAAKQGDLVALQIIDHQLDALSNQMALLFKRHPDITKNIAVAGGLSANPFYMKLLLDKISRRSGGIQCSVLQTKAEDAALQMAAERFKSFPD